jgi:hypothetical protein
VGDQGGNGVHGDGRDPHPHPPVEHARLAIGCLWGVPFSLALWALILWALWRLVS